MRNTLILVLLSLLSLAGCSSVSPKAEAPPQPGGERAKPAPADSKKGGYYLDDGPGEGTSIDIDAIPDAVPRAEAPLNRANRPYSALGNQYTPMTEYQPYKARGIATWYGKRYHGNQTSSGEIYDMYGMSAAHPTLPIPSYVRVTNPENGKSVVVRVNDRGPFLKDRLIDLSYAAAHKLRLIAKGSGMVEVEAIDTRMPATTVAATAVETSAPISPATETAAGSGNGVFVQLGAFREKQNADQLRQRVTQQNLAQNVAVRNWYNGGIYRVRLGPYNNRVDAERAADNIRRTLDMPTLVIIQQETP